MISLFWLPLLLHAAIADTDSKRWVWSSGRRIGNGDEPITYTGLTGSKGYTAALVAPSKSLFQPSADIEDSYASPSSKLRYEVTDSGEIPSYPSRPQVYPQQQYRPTTSTVNGHRPSGFDRPDNGYRPNGGYRPNENNYRPSDNFRPGIDNSYRPGSGASYRPTSGPNGRPILTGPVPSWEQRDDDRYRDYDKCKCVHSFNCNTPGIKFGTCDLDKQYCCYRDVHSHKQFGPDFVNRPRPVLAGPGGPIDRPGHYRPSHSDSYDRPGSGYVRNDRYSKGYRDSNFGLEDAYRKGLESVIHESIQSASRFDHRRDYHRDHDLDFNRKPYGGKYGLYQAEPGFYNGRSTNSTILAEKAVA